MFRLFVVASVIVCTIFVGVIVLIESPLVRSSGGLGQLLFADYPRPNENFAVDIVDLERGSISSLQQIPYQDVGFLYFVDEQQVYSSICFGYLKNDPTLCSAPVMAVIAPEEVHRFDDVSQFWKDNYYWPIWSPDAKYIAFSFDVFRQVLPIFSTDIYVMNADGSHIVNVTHGTVAYSPNFIWSPDSQQIAFECNTSQSLCIVNIDGSHMQNFVLPTDAYVAHEVWSPDGSQIVFSMVAKDARTAALYLVNADGSNMHQLLEGGSNYHGYPRWSPDGSKIVFWSSRRDRTDIYVIKRDGADLHNLSRSLDGNQYGYAVWSPDGMNVAFLSRKGKNDFSLYIADVSRGKLQEIAANDLLISSGAIPREFFWTQ